MQIFEIAPDATPHPYTISGSEIEESAPRRCMHIWDSLRGASEVAQWLNLGAALMEGFLAPAAVQTPTKGWTESINSGDPLGRFR